MSVPYLTGILHYASDSMRLSVCDLRPSASTRRVSREPARKNHALACLTFAEMDNQDTSRLRGKKAVLEHQQKLYEITEQLLEARDVGFLDKAALW